MSVKYALLMSIMKPKFFLFGSWYLVLAGDDTVQWRDPPHEWEEFEAGVGERDTGGCCPAPSCRLCKQNI